MLISDEELLMHVKAGQIVSREQLHVQIVSQWSIIEVMRGSFSEI